MKKIFILIVAIFLSVSSYQFIMAGDLIDLAYKAYNNGDDNKSIQYFKKIIKRQIKSLGLNHPKVAKSYFVLAMSYGHKNKHEDALRFHNISLAIRKKTLDKKHIDVASSYNALADTYLSMGKTKEALKYYFSAFAVKLLIPSQKLPTIESLFLRLRSFYKDQNNLRIAGFYDLQSDTSKLNVKSAKRLLIRAQKNRSKDNPYLAEYYHKLAATYAYKGEFDVAIKHHMMGIQFVEKHWGINDDTLPIAYMYLSWAYLGKSDLKTAVKYAEKAYDIAKKVKKRQRIMMMLAGDYLGAIKYFSH